MNINEANETISSSKIFQSLYYIQTLSLNKTTNKILLLKLENKNGKRLREFNLINFIDF